jgi:hypothetical protein
MKAKDALKLNPGDEVVEKKTNKSIRVICAFEDVFEGHKHVVMIEGTRVRDGHYDHWSSDQVK